MSEAARPGESQADAGMPGEGGGGRRLWLLALAIAIVLGGVLRASYLGHRALRGDEDWFAKLVYEPDIPSVFAATVGHDQAIPAPLFLLAEHLACRLFGNTPFALRLLPCLAGILALPLLAWLLRRHFRRSTVLLTLLLVAFSPFFVFWSKDAKQYSSEMLLGLCLFACVERLLQHGFRGRDWALFLFTSLAGALGSYTIVFLYPAAFAVLAVALLRRRSFQLFVLLAVSILTVDVFGEVYQRFAIQRVSAWLEMFWTYHYVNFTSLEGWVVWHLWKLVHFLNRPFNPFFSGFVGWPEYLFAAVIGLLAAAGLWSWLRRPRARYLAYALVPLVALYLAAAVKRYPLEDRLALFLSWAPLPFLAAGILGLHRLLARAAWSKWPSRALLAALALAYAGWSVHEELVEPTAGGVDRAVMEETLRCSAERGNPPQVYYQLQSFIPTPYFFYVPPEREREPGVLLGRPDWWGWPFRRRHAEAVAAFLARHPRRVAWLVFVGGAMLELDRRAVLERAQEDRALLEEVHGIRTSAYLLDRPR